MLPPGPLGPQAPEKHMTPDPAEDARPQENVSVDDRRRSERVPLRAPVEMIVETGQLVGTTDNLSTIGVLFFSQEPLRVSIRVDVDGEEQTFAGRLVRVQRMSDQSTGFAVEFESEH